MFIRFLYKEKEKEKKKKKKSKKKKKKTVFFLVLGSYDVLKKDQSPSGDKGSASLRPPKRTLDTRAQMLHMQYLLTRRQIPLHISQQRLARHTHH
jgi:hypothetical protein